MTSRGRAAEGCVAAAGALGIALVLATRAELAIALGLPLVALLVWITLTDLSQRVIPNRLLLVAIAAGALIAFIGAPESLPARALAAGAAGAFFGGLALAHPGGMGMGDVKLAAVMGWFLVTAVVPALAIAFLLGGVLGLALLIRRGPAAAGLAIPFGPFLAVGGISSLLIGNQVVDWYLARL